MQLVLGTENSERGILEAISGFSKVIKIFLEKHLNFFTIYLQIQCILFFMQLYVGISKKVMLLKDYIYFID